MPSHTSAVIRCVAAVLLLGSIRHTSQALDLATFDVLAQGGGIGETTGVRVMVIDNFFGPGSSPTYRLFKDLALTPADVGSTFIASLATDPDFATFEQAITNGINDSFGYAVDLLPNAGGSSHTWTEINLFAPGTRSFGIGEFNSIGQLSGPDFAGYDILQVLLTVDSFTLTNTGGWSSHDFRGTATIVAVPELSSLMVPAILGMALSLRRRRFQ